MMEPSLRRAVVFLAVTFALTIASAARLGQQGVTSTRLTAAADHISSKSTKRLNTYYFDAYNPIVELSRRPARPERTPLTVKLTQSSLSTFMPIVAPQRSGMVHSVSRTWQALQNLATMFTHVNTINQQSPAASPLFPKAALAVGAASDNSPVKLDMDTVIQMAEASNQRHMWAEVTPSSVLLLPFGQSTGAIADVLDVTWDNKAEAISLELDLVHHPHTISEFEPHNKQTLDVAEAHYHFDTAPGVNVDAQALLKSLESGSFQLQGVHLFMKGKGNRYNHCFDWSLTADRLQADIGSLVTLTASIKGVIRDCVCYQRPDCCQGGRQPCLSGYCGDCCADDPCCGPCCGDVCTGQCGGGMGTCCSYSPCCNAADLTDPCCGQYCPDECGDGSASCCIFDPCCGSTDPNCSNPPPVLPRQNPRTSPAIKPGAPLPTPTKLTPKQNTSLWEGSDQRQYWPNYLGPFGNVIVFLSLLGNGVMVDSPSRLSLGQHQGKSSKVLATQRPGFQSTDATLALATDADGKVTFKVSVTGPGPIPVYVASYEYDALWAPVGLTINAQGDCVGAPVAALQLYPFKAYARCHDSITLSAIALDASSQPVSNANVSFSVYGDCNPAMQQAAQVTGADGIAKVVLKSSEPGAVTVVAAVLGSNGEPVVSKAAHVFFFDDRHNAEDRERKYFEGPYDDADGMSDADRYTQVAAQRAQQMVQVKAAT